MLFAPFAWNHHVANVRDEPLRTARANRVELRRFAGPAAYAHKMNPIRVAHLTDLHVGRITPFAIQREALERAADAVECWVAEGPLAAMNRFNRKTSREEPES